METVENKVGLGRVARGALRVAFHPTGVRDAFRKLGNNLDESFKGHYSRWHGPGNSTILVDAQKCLIYLTILTYLGYHACEYLK